MRQHLYDFWVRLISYIIFVCFIIALLDVLNIDVMIEIDKQRIYNIAI